MLRKFMGWMYSKNPSFLVDVLYMVLIIIFIAIWSKT